MTENIKIPAYLLLLTVYLLEQIDIDKYPESFRYDYSKVLNALNKKAASRDLHEAYSKIIHAQDEDSRHTARIHYLQLKRSFQEEW